ncbi:DUF192 domain-containing protein [Desulfallas sp. Bu1-1]|uniref:DUF192 domain-containing protein n=1 Tax=Desulfallas sp. Bu1-1 TaxID=2787620 RepID=UPI0018A0068F|nr:DUF192 domain-containing protein [Desulfallas sp. Bu1-1]MBF7084346.1 DUF192 domain-containing protein [Desulfallas sp. Bu1-1]
MKLLVVNGRQIAGEVIVAQNFTARLKGLLGRKGLAPGSALVTKPCNSIHTWFMKFNIDVLFIGRSGRVVKAVEDLRPFKVATARVAAFVIELPAGTIREHGIKTGDVVEVVSWIPA